MTRPRKRAAAKSPSKGSRRGAFRAAIAQFAPVYLDKAASLSKAIGIVQGAKKRGIELLVFGETWLPGYPAWLDVAPKVAFWDHPPTKRIFARLRQNSITVPGPETAALCKAAGELGISVVIGVNERVDSGPGNGTLYNTLLTITSDGKLANRHRKLAPTYTERMIWGNGDGGGLTSAGIGRRIGGLICWERWMPLARMAMHNSREHVHVAVWPTAHELHQLCSRHYAFEGRCFVLAAGLMMHRRDIPAEFRTEAALAAASGEWVERGGGAIIAPATRYLVEPVYDREELIVADFDFNEIDEAVMTLDVSGHYSRPDVFTFETRSTTK